MVAVLAAVAGLVAALSGSTLATRVVVPLALLTLAAGGLALARLLERYRRYAEARVASEAAAKTMRILDRSNEAYVGMDASGTITAWNAAAEGTFGWKHSEAIGRELADLIVPEDMRRRHRAGLERFLVTGNGPMIGPRTELIARHRNGSEVPVELSVTALEEDGTWSFHGFVRDITDRKLLEDQQAKLLRPGRGDGADRLADGAPQPPPLGRGAGPRAGAGAARADPALRGAARPRPLQGLQRHPRPPRGRPPPAQLRRCLADGDSRLRLPRALRRRGVRGAAARLRHRGGDGGDRAPAGEHARGQTVSAGVAQWNGYEATAALIDRADLALYEAKRGGRDRATAAQPH